MSTYLFASIFGISLLSLVVAILFARHVLAQDKGTPKMQEIAEAIREGAMAFLRRQYVTIGILSLVMVVVILGAYSLSGDFSYGWHTALAFVLGAACSALSGFLGMYMSVKANLRTAAAAQHSVNKALKMAIRGGAFSGILVVALSLLGVGGLFVAYGGVANPTEVPLLLVGFGFGASFVALFAQLGGGIYTKAADVGADLVGKVEAGIPEDDPRNPAVIADLVGDNVGDCAGRGADLFESTAAENIGAMILGIALFPVFGFKGIIFPLVARAFGLIASIVGVMVVSIKESQDPMKGLNKGYFVTTILSIVGFGISSYLLLTPSAEYLLANPTSANAWMWFFGAGLVGIVASVAFVYITQYYTEYRYRPVKEIAEASETGGATNIISGFAVGLESTGLPVLVISASLIASYYLGNATGIIHGGLYGTAVATMGMLATAAYILAMDNFGPITDNAGGIVEMSKAPEEIRKRTDRLDAVGNTTKALTKGYAVGSAALAAFLLFSAFLEAAKLTSIDLAKPIVFVGGLIGAMLIFVFSSFAIRAVSRAAGYIINDVRAQFKEKLGIMAGTEKPDYARSVDICTKGALKEMVLPGLTAVAVPTIVGFTLGVEAVGATLMVGTIAGVVLALTLNNGGGAWDNAKKYIEMGAHGGKGSFAHKAAVVGDTVGDPFKDTAGPSLHVLIKLLSTLTLVLAPLFLLVQK
ncbi:sodium-translocating pyrophosphatase [Candidatus Peregrinibacteria bacterium CG_4_10_14_0_2_um_filter_38_24]|nr:MAG: sodium-translocating pyrophosphatase [Candidatus Peregrinibacteria bacterium CG_4_10_14_0_2_um_filter_38_24]